VPTLARTTVSLPAALHAELAGVARARYPREACGLLLGRRDGDHVRVLEQREARNLAVTADRYDLDPLDHLRAEDEARALELEVVGVWHSHPDHPARPSESDRAQAWDGWSYVIVSVSAGAVGEVRSWRLGNARAFQEEAMRP